MQTLSEIDGRNLPAAPITRDVIFSRLTVRPLE
jgi:hypothetical protein